MFLVPKLGHKIRILLYHKLW